MSNDLAGGGILALWNGIRCASLKAEYEAWHTFEHTPERVGAPGFLEARRYRSRSAHPRYFTLYHLASLSALDTPQYGELLAQPTTWSAKMRRDLSALYRMPCQLGGRYGRSMAAHAATILLAASPGNHSRLSDSLDMQLSSAVADADLVSAVWGRAVPAESPGWAQSPGANAAGALQPESWQYLVVLDATDGRQLRRTVKCLLRQLSASTVSFQSRYFEFQSRVAHTPPELLSGSWRPAARNDLLEKYHPMETNYEHPK